MPPKDALQLTDVQRTAWVDSVQRVLREIALASAGDPGPVTLRRLSNSEYRHTVHDLTGFDLNPGREFPVDSAAGEGFTNTGSALVMSPALFSKYFDAAKEIARHAVLTPTGLRFSASTTRSDWTNELMARIRSFYSQYTEGGGGTTVNLQGIIFNTNGDGKLPLAQYLAPLIKERDKLRSDETSLEQIATNYRLNLKYLMLVHRYLEGTPSASSRSPLEDHLRALWQSTNETNLVAFVQEIEQWQKALVRFQSVGHMKPWMVPIQPLVTTASVETTVPEANTDVELNLFVGGAGDGHKGDTVVLRDLRLVAAGRADVRLHALPQLVQAISQERSELFSVADRALLVAADMLANQGDTALPTVAAKHGVAPERLTPWLELLGIGSGPPAEVELLKDRIERDAKYEFVKGWGRGETPLLLTNAANEHVRVPGNMRAHAVCVHPSPTRQIAVGWRSPIAGQIRIATQVLHAHPECGNGVTWSLEVRRGSVRQRMAQGIAHGSNPQDYATPTTVTVSVGDLVSLVVGPRDGNHSCDLTDVSMSIQQENNAQRWVLADDIATTVHAGNPHPDQFGHPDTWSFYTEPVTASGQESTFPVGSLLDRWLSTNDVQLRAELATALKDLLNKGAPADGASPDAQLYRQLSSLGGPLLARALKSQLGNATSTATNGNSPSIGVIGATFGPTPDAPQAAASDLVVRAPAHLRIRVPADLATKATLVASAALQPDATGQGSAQVWCASGLPAGWDALSEPARIFKLGALRSDVPVLVQAATEPQPLAAQQRYEASFAKFRDLFPPALCYPKIVPVDEVVTLTLYHREDENLQRLMLDDASRAELDRLWDELHFVSRDAFAQVDAFAQLMEYATQDSNPALFEPFRKPIMEHADQFRRRLIETEPVHVEALVKFAELAYRRPLTSAEAGGLRTLYTQLRSEELEHDAAIQMLLARVFSSPAFLYRLEAPGPAADAVMVTDWELATRLSYCLWASPPDALLREVAAAGRLHEPQVLADQVRRMLKDPKVRRLAIEFGCQWLNVRDFDEFDEKSEQHFPEFKELRGLLYEESILTFTDMFQNDRSVLELLRSDATFLNERLAKHYGIPGITGDAWRRVEGVTEFQRGGILFQGATLAKQSGASRTSPILRGNWVSETLLGEKLPKPPKDVPPLPTDEATETLTVRQLVERHSSDPRCSSCHQRIDGFGFALEGFDTIGRARTIDLGGRPIDAIATSYDGTRLDGAVGLQSYLVDQRRDAFLRQFTRKLLGYALGRAVQLSDEPLIDQLVAELPNHQYRMSYLVESIILSPQFTQIRGQASLAVE